MLTLSRTSHSDLNNLAGSMDSARVSLVVAIEFQHAEARGEKQMRRPYRAQRLDQEAAAVSRLPP